MVFAEEGQLIGAAVVFQHGAGIGFAGFGGKLFEIRHDARHIDLGRLLLGLALADEIAQIGQLAVGEVLDFKAVTVQRVRAQVHTHQVLFPLEHFHDIHIPLCVREGRAFRLHLFHVAEQGGRAGQGVVGIQVSVAGNQVYEHFPAAPELEVHAAFVAETVQGTGVHQALEALAVHAAGHPFHKVVNVCEQAVFFTFPDNGIYDVGAKPLDAAQGKTHISVLVHRKVGFALVHVRTEHLDTMAFAVVHDLHDLFHALGAVQAGSEEFRRIVALEPAGLVAYPGVAGGVGLVEGVLGELLPVLPNLVQHLFRMSVGLAARHELVFQGIQDVYLLLAHGLAELVGLAFGEAGQSLGQQHHLLLVHGDAVGILQELLHLRKVVLDGLFAQLAGHEIRDVIHRPGPVEGVHGDEVLEAGGTQLLEPGFHAFRFELEHGSSVSTAVEFIGGLVVDGDGFYVYVFPVVGLDQVQAVVDDLKGDQAQEVHLEHAHILYIMAVVLGGAHIQARFLIFGQADGQVVRKVSPADDGGAGMHAHLAHTAFQGLGIFQHFLVDLRAVFQFLDKLRHQAVAVFEGNLDIHVFQAPLEHFSIVFHNLETGL